MKVAYAKLPITPDERAEFARQGYVKVLDIRFKPAEPEPEKVAVVEQPKKGKRK